MVELCANEHESQQGRTDLSFLNLFEESSEALDRDGLHVVAVVIQLLQNCRADTPLHSCIDLVRKGVIHATT